MMEKKTDFQLLREELLEKLFSNGKYNKVKWKSYPDFRSKIENTPLIGYATLAEKIIALRENFELRPGCEICGKPTKLKSSHFTRTCGNRCASLLPDRIEKTKLTNLARRSVEFPTQNYEVKNKVQQTVLEKYGVRVSSQAESVKEAAKKNNFEKYGVSSTFLLPQVKEAKQIKLDAASVKQKRKQTLNETWELNKSAILEKTKSTNLNKYGHEFVLQVPEIIERGQKTCISKYGANHWSQSKEVQVNRRQKLIELYNKNQLADRLALIKQQSDLTPLFTEWIGSDSIYKWKHDTCGLEFDAYLSDGIIPTCPNCRPKSKPQQKVSDFCKSLGLVVKDNDRTQIKPYEIDVFLIEKNIGIEVNGIYWHQHDSALSLLAKTELAESKNLQLLHFWDYEVIHKFEIVSSIIAAKCGIFKNRYYARKCELVTISAGEAKSFFDKNHLSGFVPGSNHFGLKFGELLICCASFGKPRFGKEETIELLRFASLLNTQIVGGLSRLIKHAAKLYDKPIISFADRRISSGDSYTKSGFNLVRKTAPNYFYVKNSKKGFEILKRYGAMKHKLPTVLGDKFDKSLTEGQNMQNSGWIKCSDSGNLKFVNTQR